MMSQEGYFCLVNTLTHSVVRMELPEEQSCTQVVILNLKNAQIMNVMQNSKS